MCFCFMLFIANKEESHPASFPLCTRAVDPHSFFADPDPAVLLNADPDPAALNCGSGSNQTKYLT